MREGRPLPAYLDYNATSPLRPEAAEAITRALACTGNPSSVHVFGRAARRVVEDAREAVAAAIGARSADIVFTSGGTEANALALVATGRDRVIVSAIEHESILASASALAPDGRAVQLPVTFRGIVDLDALDALLSVEGETSLVSVMLANNETGVLQPVAEVVRRAHAAGALVHCDAIQAMGRVPVSVEALGVDLLSMSAHKLGGPQGAGALYVRPGLNVRPLLRGGGQERGRRAGTENVAALAGFGAAMTAAMRDMANMDALAALRDRLEATVLARSDLARIIGAALPRLPNTSCIALPGVPSETQVMALDLAGVAVSAGSACSSGKVKASHVLAAMGEPPHIAGSAIRVSIGWATQPDDIDRFLDAWSTLAKRAAA